MSRLFRIRDTQRFIFLALLFPLMPLLLAVIRPTWTPWMFACAVCFVVFTFWMLFRTRELEIGENHIRIDRGYWEQQLSHEEIYELYLIRNHRIQIRSHGRTRVIRITSDDYDHAVQALHRFAWRHAIPMSDRRPRAVRGNG